MPLPGSVLIVPLIYHGLAAAFGAKTKYLTVVAGYAYTQVIQIIPQLLTAVVAWPRESLEALLAVASSLDVFDIWAFFVGSIALSKTTRFSPRGAKYVVGGVWLSYILLKVCLGGVYSAFTG